MQSEEARRWLAYASIPAGAFFILSLLFPGPLLLLAGGGEGGGGIWAIGSALSYAAIALTLLFLLARYAFFRQLGDALADFVIHVFVCGALSFFGLLAAGQLFPLYGQDRQLAFSAAFLGAYFIITAIRDLHETGRTED